MNIFEAIGNGTLDGLKLAANVGAMLIAFVAMIALINACWEASAAGSALRADVTGNPRQTVGALAFMIGVPWSEAAAAGSLIGQKFIMSEFIAYLSSARSGIP